MFWKNHIEKDEGKKSADLLKFQQKNTHKNLVMTEFYKNYKNIFLKEMIHILLKVKHMFYYI